MSITKQDLDTGPDAVAAVVEGIKSGSVQKITYFGTSVANHITDLEYESVAVDAIQAYVAFLTAPKI